MDDKVTAERIASWKWLASEEFDYQTSFVSVLHYSISARASLQEAVAEIERLMAELADARAALGEQR